MPVMKAFLDICNHTALAQRTNARWYLSCHACWVERPQFLRHDGAWLKQAALVPRRIEWSDGRRGFDPERQDATRIDQQLPGMLQQVTQLSLGVREADTLQGSADVHRRTQRSAPAVAPETQCEPTE